MHALVIHGPRDVRVETMESPKAGPGQLLVRVAAGGVCGSDLHYFRNGGFGAVRLKNPMALGHECCGAVAAIGDGVEGFPVGTRVAVRPSLPCGKCVYCREGKYTHCMDMRYYGSAMRVPHIDGVFRQELVIERDQAYIVPDSVSDAEAAMTEPLAVALHAVRRAGSLFGKRVLVTGCGPIGVLIIMAARLAGAVHITATDVGAGPLTIAADVGADETIDVAENPQALSAHSVDKGDFDVLFEASGNPAALLSGIECVRPQGLAMQLGLGGQVDLALNSIVFKEIELRGAFRFHEEFGMAVDLMASRRIDVKPLISGIFPYQNWAEAFALAEDRSRAMKVLLTFA